MRTITAANISLGEALSTHLVRLRSCTFTLPEPAPRQWAEPLF